MALPSVTSTGCMNDSEWLALPWTDLLRSLAADSVRAPYLKGLVDEHQRGGGSVASGDREAVTRRTLQAIYTEALGRGWGRAGLRPLSVGFVDDGHSADFRLFMLMVLGNRQDLARLFWRRDARERAADALHTALLACALCRSLARRLDRGSALDSLSLTAEWFESFASRVLVRVHRESAEAALRWMVERHRAVKCFPGAAAIDLVVRGRCALLIQECGELCIDAVQIMFSGNDGMYRMADGCLEKLIGMLPGPWSRTLGALKSDLYRHGLCFSLCICLGEIVQSLGERDVLWQNEQ